MTRSNRITQFTVVAPSDEPAKSPFAVDRCFVDLLLSLPTRATISPGFAEPKGAGRSLMPADIDALSRLRLIEPLAVCAQTPTPGHLLTRDGVAFARNLARYRANEPRASAGFFRQLASIVAAWRQPVWEVERRVLRVGPLIVKEFRRPAKNQTCILTVFEEQGWAAAIDDPLPGNGRSDSKQRLHDAIVDLNQHQLAPLVHFRGNGTGQGVEYLLRALRPVD